MKRACLGIVAMALAACGGGGGTSETKTPSSSGVAPKNPEDSIGTLAAAQGGIAALGGAGNREDGATGNEAAMTGPLRAEEMDRNNPVKLDGVLKEWHPRSPAHEAVSGQTSAELEIGALYDDTRLFIAAEITDSKLVRSARHADADDHVSMAIAFPEGRGGLKAYAIGLWPGKPGDSTGAVRWLAGPHKGKDVAGARIVEYDSKNGTVFEAAIPWSSFAEARTLRVGLRAAFRYHDGDGSTTAGVVATGSGDVDKATDLPPFPTPSEQAVVDGLLTEQKLAGKPPKIDVFADIAGDERFERISVFGHFFTICGPGYRGGRQFFWRQVHGSITSAETRAITGRPKDDVIVRRKIKVGDAVHEILEVWSVMRGDEPTTLFSHEVAVFSTDGKKRVANTVRVSPKEIEIATDTAAGWDAASFNEPSINDVTPALLPWGTVKSRTFRFDKGKFEAASEVAQKGASPAATPATTNAEAPPPRDPPTPEVRKGTDLGKQVLEAYFRDGGIAPTKPRFDLEVHVDGDARPERVALIGRDIVVLGPGFNGGNRYARMTLTQFADEKDISEMTARDVTGDGAAEIIVRGVRHLTTPANERVDVEGLFIYHVKNGALSRAFAVETAREQGKNRIQGLVQFVPAKNGKGFDIDARAGIAKGWTDKTYPWPEDKPGTGPVEPLLLPWGALKNVRYAWNGSQFAAP